MRILFITLVLVLGYFKSDAQVTNSSTNTSSNSSSKGESKKAVNTFEKALAQPGASLPRLTWLSADEKVFADSNLRSNTPLILVLFNPSCGHCMEVAVTFKARIQELANTDIVFLTGSNLLAELPSFIQQTRMTGMPNVHIGIDYTDVSKQLFEYNGIPQIMVYNRSHVLLKTYYKQLNLDEVVRLVRSE
jgi:thiol-disulfide isomerase/thioredoxin